MLKVSITLSALLLVAVSATPFRDCGSTWTLNYVNVPGCSALPCVVYRGTNVTVDYDTIASSAAATLTIDLTGTFGGVTLPWPGYFPPVCDTLLNGDCPVQLGENIQPATVLVLSSSFPQVDAKATWKLRDENNEVVICFEVPVKLL